MSHLLLFVQLALGLVGQPNARVLPRFEDFLAGAIFSGPLIEPVITDSRLGRAYRTRIRSGAKAGPNFAGHFTLVTWGCGSPCQDWAIVDAQTGRVFESVIRSTAGAEFYPNSRLLIIDSPRMVSTMFNGEVPTTCAVCGTPDAYEWTGVEWRTLPGFDASRLRKY